MADEKLPDNITWKAQRQQFHRSFLWYLGFILVSVGLILYSVYIDHSIITLIMFGLLIIVVWISISQKPQTITYKLTKLGIHSDSTYYPYNVIKNFWIIYLPPQTKTVNFRTAAYINNKISFEIGSQDPVKIKLFLSQYIAEDLEQGQRLFDTLARTLKI